MAKKKRKKDYSCKLFPFERVDCLSIQDAKQKSGWSITAFDLPKTWQFTQGEGVVIAVLDSTPEWSPILCRDALSGQIKIMTIKEIFSHSHEQILITNKKEEIKSVYNLEVWSGHTKHGKHWQKITRVIRHHYNGTIRRINLRGGLVDVTPNHSVIGSNGSVFDASKVIIGSKLCLAKLNKVGKSNGFFRGSTDLAWLMGFWAAEGSLCYTKSNGNYTVSLSQKDIEPLLKSQNIFQKELHVHSHITEPDDAGMRKMIISNKIFYNWVKENWITEDGQKKVPDDILNATEDVALEFLRGYNLGDGYTKNTSWEFSSWTTIDQVLACGLIVLIEKYLQQSYTIQTRQDKINVIQITLNQPCSDKKLTCRSTVQKIHEFEFNGMVYDLETEDHTFGCGVGTIRIHNTGCDLDHPDLKENLLPGKNFVHAKKPPVDGNGHGTHIIGTLVASNNDIGVVGVCPKAKVRPVKVLDDRGNGNLLNVSKGIRWAVRQGVDIISMSLGAPVKVQQVRKAIQFAALNGIPTFVAAGNAGNTKEVFYPANYPETIAIGAIDENFRRAKFSNTGDNLDFMAPGVDIMSTVPDNWYATLSGTSMATPFAVGVAALVLSHVRAKNPELILKTVNDYRKVFRKYTTSIKGKNKKFHQGFGIIDPRKMMEEID